MAKTKAKTPKGDKKRAPDTAPRILLLGNGAALPWWFERLEEARADFVHLESQGEEALPWANADLIIETEDLRYDEVGAHDHEHGEECGPDCEHDHGGDNDEDELLPTVGGNGKSHAREHEQGSIMLAGDGAILVPCYSSSPTMLASIYADNAGQVIGYTLFPRPDSVPGLGIIEVARPLLVDDDVWEAALARLVTLGFTPEVVGDAPAGIFGRNIAMLVNEAALAFSEGIASTDDIDNAMKLGVNYPKGLFEWADELGADLILDMLEGLYDHYLDDRYRPAPLLKHVVAAGIKFREL